MSVYQLPPSGPQPGQPPCERRAENIAEWAAWDADGRTPSWADLTRHGELDDFESKLPAASSTDSQEVLKRQARRRRLTDPTPLTRGQLRRWWIAMRKRLNSEIAEALDAQRKGQPQGERI